MTRTAAVFSGGGFSVVCLVSAALVTGQAKPEGSPHCRNTTSAQTTSRSRRRGIANPPMVVDQARRRLAESAAGVQDRRVRRRGPFKTLRYIIEGPNGDVFAADSTANTITILRDTDNDGKADERHVFAEGLKRPFGMAIANGYFYVGNTDSVVRWKYAPGQLKAEGTPEKITELPGGGHWTRALASTPTTPSSMSLSARCPTWTSSASRARRSWR